MKQEFIQTPSDVARATDIGDVFTVKGEKYQVKSVRRGDGIPEIELVRKSEEQTVELENE